MKKKNVILSKKNNYKNILLLLLYFLNSFQMFRGIIILHYLFIITVIWGMHSFLPGLRSGFEGSMQNID